MQLVIDNLDADLHDRLEERARGHGHSIAEEAREILRDAIVATPVNDEREDLGNRLARRFAGLGLDQEISELRFGEIKAPTFEP